MGVYKKELVQAVAEALTSYGYDVYLARSGEYGFYTNGKRVVCFDSQWELSINFSGNYAAGQNAKYCGTGWQIAADTTVPTKEEAGSYIQQVAPEWATKGHSVKYTAPEMHLKTYGASSGYEKFNSANH